MFDKTRMLIDPSAEDAEDFVIAVTGTCFAVEFRTGGVNGKSARDTAIANTLDASEQTGEMRLNLFVYESTSPVRIATAQCGCQI